MADTRLSQVVVEVLTLPAPPPIRVSQDAVELLSLPLPPPIRLSQSVVEVLTAAPTGNPNVTQLAVETLSHPTPVPLATQFLVETLSAIGVAAAAQARVTQQIVETLTHPTPTGRVSQLVAETLTASLHVAATASLTQLVVETATKVPPSPLRVSQAPIELLGTPPATARVSQAPVELIEQRAPAAVGGRVSQAALEIIYPFGCYQPLCTNGEFPVDAVDSASGCDQLLVIADAGLGSVCGTEGGGTPPPPLPRVPAGSIMVGGWGDAGHCVFLSPDGATSYPPVGDWPSTQVDVSAFCRLTTGDIALVGGNAPQFPETGSGVLKASDLSTLSQYTGDRPGQFAIAADALGNWYTFRLGGSTGFFTRMNAASAQTGAWDIALGVYADSQVWAMAISADGLTAYVWLQAGVFGSDPTRFNYHILVCSLAGAGALGAVLTTDYNYQAPSAGSLLVVPGSGDIIAGFRHLNGSSTVTAPSVIRRYTPAGALVWTATFPAGAADWATWMYLAHGVPGSTHFLAYAYDDIDTSSSARYTWFSYATGAPDNTRNFAPDAGSFEFDSQFVVLATDIL